MCLSSERPSLRRRRDLRWTSDPGSGHLAFFGHLASLYVPSSGWLTSGMSHSYGVHMIQDAIYTDISKQAFFKPYFLSLLFVISRRI